MPTAHIIPLVPPPSGSSLKRAINDLYQVASRSTPDVQDAVNRLFIELTRISTANEDLT
jgi:hypothetical protein